MGLPPLLRVHADPVKFAVVRRGRFSVPVELAKSPVHLEHAIKDAQERMIKGLESKGYKYLGTTPEYPKGFKIEGPLEHIAFSEDATPDTGPVDAPDPRDTEAQAAYARAERTRIAKRLQVQQDEATAEVDFLLRAPFVLTVDLGYRRTFSSLSEARLLNRRN